MRLDLEKPIPPDPFAFRTVRGEEVTVSTPMLPIYSVAYFDDIYPPGYRDAAATESILRIGRDWATSNMVEVTSESRITLGDGKHPGLKIEGKEYDPRFVRPTKYPEKWYCQSRVYVVDGRLYCLRVFNAADGRVYPGETLDQFFESFRITRKQ